MRGYNGERGRGRAVGNTLGRDKLLIFTRVPGPRQCHQIKTPFASAQRRASANTFCIITLRANKIRRNNGWLPRRWSRGRAREYLRDLPNFTTGSDSATHMLPPSKFTGGNGGEEGILCVYEKASLFPARRVVIKVISNKRSFNFSRRSGNFFTISR